MDVNDGWLTWMQRGKRSNNKNGAVNAIDNFPVSGGLRRVYGDKNGLCDNRIGDGKMIVVSDNASVVSELTFDESKTNFETLRGKYQVKDDHCTTIVKSEKGPSRTPPEDPLTRRLNRRLSLPSPVPSGSIGQSEPSMSGEMFELASLVTSAVTLKSNHTTPVSLAKQSNNVSTVTRGQELLSNCPELPSVPPPSNDIEANGHSGNAVDNIESIRERSMPEQQKLPTGIRLPQRMSNDSLEKPRILHQSRRLSLQATKIESSTEDLSQLKQELLQERIQRKTLNNIAPQPRDKRKARRHSLEGMGAHLIEETSKSQHFPPQQGRTQRRMSSDATNPTVKSQYRRRHSHHAVQANPIENDETHRSRSGMQRRLSNENEVSRLRMQRRKSNETSSNTGVFTRMQRRLSGEKKSSAATHNEYHHVIALRTHNNMLTRMQRRLSNEKKLSDPHLERQTATNNNKKVSSTQTHNMMTRIQRRLSNEKQLPDQHLERQLAIKNNSEASLSHVPNIVTRMQRRQSNEKMKLSSSSESHMERHKISNNVNEVTCNDPGIVNRMQRRLSNKKKSASEPRARRTRRYSLDSATAAIEPVHGKTIEPRRSEKQSRRMSNEVSRNQRNQSKRRASLDFTPKCDYDF